MSLRRSLWPILMALLLSMAAPARAQDFSALARLDVAQSGVEQTAAGFRIDLYLSQPVPWRVFTLEDPQRLVLDFRTLDWRGATREGLLNADGVSDLHFALAGPGWTRMVLTLAEPHGIETAEMAVDEVTGTARLTLSADRIDAESFGARAGLPEGVEPVLIPRPQTSADDGPLVVAIDPGHGGIDPGAERDGVKEADLMLDLGLELAEALARAGMLPVLTRQDDSFVSLAERLSLARAAEADLFLSLHADALQDANARGASVYLLSREAQDQASQRMAERHERGDLLAGLDLSDQDDTIATVLMDLARLETAPRSARLSAALVSGMRETGARLNSRPQRAAMLAVLLSADMPSVLIEAGFLSDPGDREALTSPDGRAPIVAGIVAGVQAWALEDAALRALSGQ